MPPAPAAPPAAAAPPKPAAEARPAPAQPTPKARPVDEPARAEPVLPAAAGWTALWPLAPAFWITCAVVLVAEALARDQLTDAEPVEAALA